MAACEVCQVKNNEHIHHLGLLQPLPIPTETWTDIVMDFVEGRPNSGSKNAILVVVDRLTKYGHFIPISNPYTASQIASVFIQ